MIYPNFRDVEGKLFLILDKDNKEIFHEQISSGEAWRLTRQLLKYLENLDNKK